MHDLAKWMEGAGESDETLASKLGISRASVNRIRNRVQGASKATALKLEAVTGIAWHEFIGPVDEPAGGTEAAE